MKRDKSAFQSMEAGPPESKFQRIETKTEVSLFKKTLNEQSRTL